MYFCLLYSLTAVPRLCTAMPSGHREPISIAPTTKNETLKKNIPHLNEMRVHWFSMIYAIFSTWNLVSGAFRRTFRLVGGQLEINFFFTFSRYFLYDSGKPEIMRTHEVSISANFHSVFSFLFSTRRGAAIKKFDVFEFGWFYVCLLEMHTHLTQCSLWVVPIAIEVIERYFFLMGVKV